MKQSELQNVTSGVRDLACAENLLRLLVILRRVDIEEEVPGTVQVRQLGEGNVSRLDLVQQCARAMFAIGYRFPGRGQTRRTTIDCAERLRSTIALYRHNRVAMISEPSQPRE